MGIKLVKQSIASRGNAPAGAKEIFIDTTSGFIYTIDESGNTVQYAPQLLSTPLNYKLTPTVSSNNLTLALKTLAGTDPSPTDPLIFKIGDSWRAVTAALSVTKNAGTNWFASGATALATFEIDYFAYIGYNTTDGVTLGYARFPSARQYSDFSATTTNEKYCAISTITTAASTDYYEVIGRFAATLSATASFNWSVPTYTAINLIQEAIYETRTLSYTPQWAATGTAPAIGNAVIAGYYRIKNGTFISNMLVTFGNTSTYGTGNWTFSLPFTTSALTNSAWFGEARALDSSANTFYFGGISSQAGNTVLLGFHGALFATVTIPFTWATSDSVIFQIEAGL